MYVEYISTVGIQAGPNPAGLKLRRNVHLQSRISPPPDAPPDAVAPAFPPPLPLDEAGLGIFPKSPPLDLFVAPPEDSSPVDPDVVPAVLLAAPDVDVTVPPR